MHLREQGPGAIRGFAFKDATPDRPSPASSARRKSNNKEKPRLKILLSTGSFERLAAGMRNTARG
jgi:hypothetical protein